LQPDNNKHINIMTKSKYQSPWAEAVRMDEESVLCQSVGGSANDLVANPDIDIFA